MDDFEKMSFDADELNEEAENYGEEVNEEVDTYNEEVDGGESTGEYVQNTEDDGLYEELENIREMFQTELDNETRIYLASGDAQDCDDTADSDKREENENAISEDMLCECCGEKLRDLSEGEDYPYCEDCKNIMRSYPIGIKGILALILAIVIGLSSLMLNFSANAEILDKAVTAKSAVTSGKLYTGLYTYYNALNSLGTSNVPKKVIAELSKVLAQLNDYNSAVSLAEQYGLEGSRYSFIEDYRRKNDTVNAIENIIYEPLSSSETSEKDAEGLCDTLEALKNDSENDYDNYYIDYYKYVVKNTLGVDKETVYEDLLKIDETYPNEWVHVYDLCDIAAKLGKVEDAEKYFRRLESNNSEEVTAYACYANVYRFCDEPDTEKMLHIVEDGEEAQGSFSFAGSANLYRIKAVAYLLQGDNKSAYEAASEMYTVVTNNSYSVNNLFPCLYTYALASYLAGEQDSYDEVVSLLKYNGYDMSQQVLSVINGDMTAEEILTDEEGDLA